VDILTDVLPRVRLNGTLLFHYELGCPWSPALPRFPDSVFHYLSRGSTIVALEDGRTLWMTAGDFVLIARGEPHVLCSGLGVKPFPLLGTRRTESARSGDCAGVAEIPSGGGAQADMRSGRKRGGVRDPREERPLTGRGANLRARTGSVSGVTDLESAAGTSLGYPSRRVHVAVWRSSTACGDIRRHGSHARQSPGQSPGLPVIFPHGFTREAREFQRLSSSPAFAG